MTMQHSHARRSPDRGAAVLALLVTAGTHLPLIGEHLEEAPYVGWLFIGLTAGALLLAVVLLVDDSTLAWAATGVLAGAAIVAFVLSRTAGLPGIGDDIGNWTDPLSYPALAAEAVAAAAAAASLMRGHDRSVSRRPPSAVGRRRPRSRPA